MSVSLISPFRHNRHITPLLKDLDKGRYFAAMANFPLLDDSLAASPDANKTLRQVIIDMVYSHYKYHNIFTTDEDIFFDRLEARAYEVMAAQQFAISQWATLNVAGEFFFNTEHETIVADRDNIGEQTDMNERITKNSDTPQNSISDIDNYMSSASKQNANDNRETASHEDTRSMRDLRKSVLTNLAKQFKEFLEIPSVYDEMLKGFLPLFKADNTHDESYP